MKKPPAQEAALEYAKRGWSVIPVGRDKKPLVHWKEYQARPADAAMINRWWFAFREANVGIVTGKVSGLAVIDVEKDGIHQNFPKTVTAESGGGGRHYYYRYPKKRDLRNGTRLPGFACVDLRAEGGYVVAPPSVHPSGDHYRWINAPDDTELAEFPLDILREWKIPSTPQAPSQATFNLEGSRNDATARFVGSLLVKLDPANWETKAWDAVVAWNAKHNIPPLAESELRTVFASIAQAEREKRTRLSSHEDKILSFCRELPNVHAELCAAHPDPDERELAFHAMLKSKRITGDHKKILLRKWAALEVEGTGTKEATPDMTATERSEALAFLKSPDLFNRIEEDLDRLGYVGERVLKLTTYLAAASAITDEPINTLNKGQSGSGKSECVKTVMALMPPERVLFVTRLTAQALAYLDGGIDRKWVIINEHDGAEGAEHSLRVSISEGELVTLAPVKDTETGRVKTEARRVPIHAAFTITTTRHLVHAENETRFFSLTTDDSSEQTQRIVDRQNLIAAGQAVISDTEREAIIHRHRNAQRLLSSYRVVIPFAEHISYPSHDVRVRRDNRRCHALIKAIAHVRQFQKDVKNSDGYDVIQADLEDYRIAYSLLGKILRDTNGVIPEGSERLLKTWIGQAQSGTIEADQDLTRRDLERLLRWSEATVRRYLGPLVNHELVAEKKDGRRFRYGLLVTDLRGLEVPKGITTPDELAALWAERKDGGVSSDEVTSLRESPAVTGITSCHPEKTRSDEVTSLAETSGSAHRWEGGGQSLEACSSSLRQKSSNGGDGSDASDSAESGEGVSSSPKKGQDLSLQETTKH